MNRHPCDDMCLRYFAHKRETTVDTPTDELHRIMRETIEQVLVEVSLKPIQARNVAIISRCAPPETQVPVARFCPESTVTGRVLPEDGGLEALSSCLGRGGTD